VVKIAADGIVIEGELKKRNYATVGGLVSAYRTRYFVLSKPDAALYYFASKAQSKEGLRPRTIPVSSFYAVEHVADKKGVKTKSFILRVIQGRPFVFEAKSVSDAAAWVKHIDDVMPRNMIALMKVNRLMLSWIRLRRAAKRAKARVVAAQQLAIKYGRSEPELRAKAIKVCASLRMWRQRKRYLAGAKMREIQERRLKALADAANVITPERQARLEAMIVKRQAKSVDPNSPWGKYFDESSGRDYWYNSQNGDTSWTDPTVLPIGDWTPLVDPGSGRNYYYNAKSGETSWEIPQVVAITLEKEAAQEASLEAAANRAAMAEKAKRAQADEEARRVAEIQAAIKRDQDTEAARLAKEAEEAKKNAPNLSVIAARAAQLSAGKAASAGGVTLPSATGGAKQVQVIATPTASPLAALALLNKEKEKSAAAAAAAPAPAPATPTASAATQASAMAALAALAKQKAADASPTRLPPPPPAPTPAPAPAAAAQATKAKASRWIQKTDKGSGRTFYANVDNGQTSWTAPPGLSDGSARLYKTWFSKTDPNSGRKFYVNVTTSATVWDRPSGYDSDGGDKAASLPPPPSADLTIQEWIEMKDPVTGRAYYYSRLTGERTWNRPAALGQAALPPPPSAAVVVDALTNQLSTRNLPIAQQQAVARTVNAQVAAAVAQPAQPAPIKRKITRCINARRTGASDVQVAEALKAMGAQVPSGADAWKLRSDPRSDRPYYFNIRTGESMWARPANVGPDGEVEGDPNEILTFTSWVNDVLAADPQLAGVRVPMDLEAATPALYTNFRDGILPAKLVYTIAPESIDVRAVSWTAVPVAVETSAGRSSENSGEEDLDAVFLADHSLGTYASSAAPALDNLRLAIAAASAAGCLVPREVSAAALARASPQAVLDFTWMLFKLQLLSPVSLARGVPGLVRLAQEGEEINDLLKLGSEGLLLRWVNYQLELANSSLAGSVDAWGPRLADGTVFCAIIRTLAPQVAADVPKTDNNAKALGPEGAVTAALSAAFAGGVPAWFSVEGIVGSNPRLQMAFAAYLFRLNPNMTPLAPLTAAQKLAAGPRGRLSRLGEMAVAGLESELARYVVTEAENDASGLSKEARLVSTWINSLDIEGVTVRPNTVVRDLRDGTLLLRILDTLEPGLVNWSRVTMKPPTKFKAVENTTYVLSLGRSMDVALAGVTGADFVDGKEKVILSFVGLLMKVHTSKALSAVVFDGFEASDEEIVAWANERVAAAATAAGQPGHLVKVRTFADAEMASGMYLLYLLSSVRPNSVAWEYVADGENRDQQIANASYAISLARKTGASVFLTPDEIVDVKPRAITLLVAALAVVCQADKVVSRIRAAATQGDRADDIYAADE
jgi:plastin-1